jgi:hypothetical protein
LSNVTFRHYEPQHNHLYLDPQKTIGRHSNKLLLLNRNVGQELAVKEEDVLPHNLPEVNKSISIGLLKLILPLPLPLWNL